jgi:hypothetical protein
MTDTSDQSIYQRFFAHYLDDLFHQLVEEGSIDVANKTVDEVYCEFRVFVAEESSLRVEDGGDLRVAFDFRNELLAQANQAAQDGHHGLALTFYAIWLEHVINGLLITALGKQGYSEGIIKPLIKELKLRTKMSSLWAIASLTPFDDEALKNVERISEQRNAFVHYKWTGYEESVRARLSSQERALVEAAKGLVELISDIESQDFWNGRQAEIAAGMRAKIAKDVEGLTDKVIEELYRQEP